ncbi:hypothetical protein ACTQ3Z_00610 [Lawsonibacter sp. LCP25S3_F5]
MRKRILSVLLCLVMLTGLFPAAALAADEEAEGPAAQVGGQTYSSLKAAITAAGEGGTISPCCGTIGSRATRMRSSLI